MSFFASRDVVRIDLNPGAVRMCREGMGGSRDLIPQQETSENNWMNNNLAWDAQCGDIILMRECIRNLVYADGRPVMRRATNVAWSVFAGSDSGYEWGYNGTGPAELAMNILNQVVPPGADEHEPIVGVVMPPYWAKDLDLECSATAIALSRQFKEEFVAKVPHAGGIISGKEIRSWIAGLTEEVAEWVTHHYERYIKPHQALQRRLAARGLSDFRF